MEQCPWLLFDAWVKILEPYFLPLFFFFWSQSTSGISANSVIIALKQIPNLPISHHLCCQHFRLANIIFHFECCCTAFQLTSHFHALLAKVFYSTHWSQLTADFVILLLKKHHGFPSHLGRKSTKVLCDTIPAFFFFWGFCFRCLFYHFHSCSLDSSCTGF